MLNLYLVVVHQNSISGPTLSLTDISVNQYQYPPIKKQGTRVTSFNLVIRVDVTKFAHLRALCIFPVGNAINITS